MNLAHQELEYLIEQRELCPVRPMGTSYPNNLKGWDESVEYAAHSNWQGIPASMANGMFCWWAPGLLKVIREGGLSDVQAV